MFKKVAILAAISTLAHSLTTTHAWQSVAMETAAVNSRGILQVGVDEEIDIKVKAGASREDVISYPNAEYISVRFDSFNLPPGDKVVVRSPDAKVAYTYTGKGRNNAGAFYATFIPGNTAVVEYVSGTGISEVGSLSGFGYNIPVFARGFPTRQTESICGGGDNSVPAKCFTNGTLYETLPLAYQRSRAVARLLINGSSLCTGWLAGSEGHLFTNQHCIDDPELVTNTDIEFDAESGSCADECKKQLGCAGTVVTTQSKFITNDDPFDYALIQLPNVDVVAKYGYLQLRGDGAQLGEEVYIPQHPKGYPKRIAAYTEDNTPAYIQSLHAQKSCGDNQVGYSADTQGGSSGSPVLAWADNLVVSLHHCGGCENQGVDIRDVIANLAAKSIVIKDLVAPSTVSPTPSTPSPTTVAPTPAPTTVLPTPAPTTPQPTTVAPTPRPTTTAPIPSPTTSKPTPAPTTAPVKFCGKFHDKFTCQIWFWCNWSASTSTCSDRF